MRFYYFQIYIFFLCRRDERNSMKVNRTQFFLQRHFALCWLDFISLSDRDSSTGETPLLTLQPPSLNIFCRNSHRPNIAKLRPRLSSISSANIYKYYYEMKCQASPKVDFQGVSSADFFFMQICN